MSARVQAASVRSPVPLSILTRTAQLVLRAERATRAEVSVALVSAARIARLNRTHLGASGFTDVIAFSLAPIPGQPQRGDVYIAPSVARSNAKRLGVGVNEELQRLVVHGVLHVLGYDHPAGSQRMQSPMWSRQEMLLARALRLPKTRPASQPLRRSSAAGE